MKKYPSIQVVTVKEVQINDLLHVGKMAGLCLELKVAKIAKDHSHFVAQVGNSFTYVKMTGIDLRDPQFPVYRKPDCPYCAINKLEEATYQKETPLVSMGDLQASDIKSSLGNIDKPRRGEAPGTGGATFRRYTERQRTMLERANRALQKQLEQ